MTKHYPKTDLSRMLAASIVKKVFVWFDNLGHDVSQHCQIGDVSMTPGLISIPYATDKIVIGWEGSPISPDAVWCSHPIVEEAERDLESFHRFEKLFYDPLQAEEDAQEKEEHARVFKKPEQR